MARNSLTTEFVPQRIVGAAKGSETVGPLDPFTLVDVHLTLNGGWTGTVSLMRSLDGGATLIAPMPDDLRPVTFTENYDGPVWTEDEAAATLYLVFAVTSGSVSYSLEQASLPEDSLARKWAAGAKANPRQPTGYSKAKYRIENGDSATFLIVSDSTGNGSASPREWPFRFADDLAAQYPTHSVSISLGDTAGWGAATTISTGTGSSAITIWCFAVPGSQAQAPLGRLFDKVIRAVTPDCFILNHGHNHFTGVPNPQLRGELLAAIEQIRLCHPETPVVVMRQNPRSDSTGMDAVMSAIDVIEALTDVSTVNVHDAFVDRNKDSSLYTDTTHPNDLGQALWGAVNWLHWQQSPSTPYCPRTPALLAPLPTQMNYLRNGGFDKWTTDPAVPDGWTKDGAGTMTPTKETTIIAREELGYSCKLLGTGGTSRIYQDVDAANLANLKGRRVSLAVRAYKSASATATVGRIQLVAGSATLGTQSISSRAYNTEMGGWMWWVISGFDVPADASYVRAVLNHDTSASPSTEAAYFDQAVLVPGYLPRRCR